MSKLRILMPPHRRLRGEALPEFLGKALARADTMDFSPLPRAGEGLGRGALSLGDDAPPILSPDPSTFSGRGAQSGQASVQGSGNRIDEPRSWRKPLLRAFDILPRGLPVAALTRGLDVPADADGSWLRADPAHVRADMATGRLLACGDLGLTPADAQALLAPLRPLFGDEGFPIDAPNPARWYLRLPERVELPAFSDPPDALGDDLRPHLPDGPLGKRWLRLMSETQVVLHNHPLNLERQRHGLPAVNSLWFWGAGERPHNVSSSFAKVLSADPLVRALCSRAGVPCEARGARLEMDAIAADTLLDLSDLRDTQALHSEWLLPALDSLKRGRITQIELDFADASGVLVTPSHRWRFWRRAWTTWA